jgi:hypothetical protein
METVGEYLVPLLILIVVAAVLTFVVFRKRAFDNGFRKGTAANPRQVKRDNPPDPKERSVNRQGA